MRNLGLKLLTLGIIVVATGVVVASASPRAPTTDVGAYRTPPQGATYVGSTTCFTCHSAEHRDWSNTLHSKAFEEVAANPKAVLADFASGDEFRQVDGKAYAAADVTYTVGSKARQRYVQKTDKGYQVLPGEWDIAAKQWIKADAADWTKDCVGCHTTGLDVAKMTWSEAGVTCEACHGPGSVHVEKAKALKAGTSPMSDEVYAVRQAIVKTTDANVCGQCHNRGTSADKQHPYPVGYVVGGPLDDTMFISVAPTGKEDDPFFWPDKTEKQNQETFLAWKASKHGKALEDLKANPGAADYCVGCHSSDFANQDKVFAQDLVTLKNAQFSITCVMCHAPHGEAKLADQLRQDSYDLCITCHSGSGKTGKSPIQAGGEVHHPMREMFEGQKLLGLGPQPSKHYSNEAFGPVCASCHMVATAVTSDSSGIPNLPSHTWQVVKPGSAAKGQKDSCTTCHTLEKSKDNTPENLSAYIDKVQKGTKKRVDGLKEDLKAIADEHKDWDPKAKDKSKEQLSYERAVTLVSFVESDGSWGFHNPEYTDTILKEAEKIVDSLLK